MPDPGATDLAVQLALLPTVTSLLREFGLRADAQAQRRRQLNTLWRAAYAYWRGWLAARIDRFRPHVSVDSLLSLLRDVVTEEGHVKQQQQQQQLQQQQRQKQQSSNPTPPPPSPLPFCGLPSTKIHSLCQKWLRGVDEQEQVSVMRHLVEFVQTNSGIVDKQLVLPPVSYSSSALLHPLLTDVCAHVKRVVTDRAYNGDLWPIVESKLRIHIGRCSFARLQTEHKQGSTDVLPADFTGGDDGGGSAHEESSPRLGGTWSESAHRI